MDNLLLVFKQLSSMLGFSHDDGQTLEQQLEANPGDIDRLLQLGIYFHDKAIEGDKEAVQRSANYLTQVLEKDPCQARAIAYLGSIYTLMGRDTVVLWKKMKYVQDGLNKIDQAVAMAPNDLTIRMLRIMNGLGLPTLFKRLQSCFKDFDHVIAQEKFTTWPIEQKALVYFSRGLAFMSDEKAEPAKSSFETSITIAPQSRWASLARAELANL